MCCLSESKIHPYENNPKNAIGTTIEAITICHPEINIIDPKNKVQSPIPMYPSANGFEFHVFETINSPASFVAITASIPAEHIPDTSAFSNM